MKTAELIRRLQEADPTGEHECVVDNRDIFFATVEPMYYDGRPWLLKRDPSKAPYWDVTGLRLVRGGDKIQIRTLSVDDVFDAVPTASVDYPDDEMRVRHEPWVEQRRAAMVAMHAEVKAESDAAKAAKP